jgi:hypothetical protein
MLPTTRPAWTLLILWSIACVAAGWTWCSHFNRSADLIIKPTAEKRLPDGSMLAGRDQAAPSARPVTIVPLGSSAVANFKVQTAPSKPIYVQTLQHGSVDPGHISQPETTEPADCANYVSHLECPEVDIVGTLIKDKQGAPNLIFNSGNAIIEHAHVDVLTQITTAPVHPWAAGLTMDSNGKKGIFADRDLGPMRVGIEAESGQAILRIGIRF